MERGIERGESRGGLFGATLCTSADAKLISKLRSHCASFRQHHLPAHAEKNRPGLAVQRPV